MRNTDDQHDPRRWRHQPSPAGRLRRPRPTCHSSSDHAFLPAQFARCPDRLPGLESESTWPLQGFTFVPAATHSAPAPVPGPAGLVALLLAAAQAHFQDSSYAVANAFLGLLRQSLTHPAATWQQLGHLHFALAEYEEAGQAYGYAAAYAPRDASLQVRLAHTCLCLEDFANFENYLRRALSLEPENTAALQLLADVNRDEGRYDEAVGYYERLLQSVPCHRANLVSLALCHSFLGAYGSALNCLQRADQAISEHILPTSPAPGVDTSS